MSINYHYLLSIVERFAEKNPEIKILDYGCGRGEIIKFARSKNIDMYGADIFHNGPSVIKQLSDEHLLGEVIREIRDDQLPFSDNIFDLIISNQVFEHVRDLEKVLGEIHRVLKPNGIVYGLFPPKEIIREGHTGIPFLHWFSKNKVRYIYALALRKIGFGKGGKSKEFSATQWVEKKLNYLDTKTFYRSAKEIKILLDKYYFWDHKEEEIISFRAAHMQKPFGNMIGKMIKIPGIKQLGNFIFTRMAGYLIVASPR